MFTRGDCDLYAGSSSSNLFRGIFLYRSSSLKPSDAGVIALKNNAVDLNPGRPRGNLTINGCTTASMASGVHDLLGLAA